MSGFNFQNRELIQKMAEGEEFYCDENISLNTRPVWNENNSICLICNGEIYNFKELRKELQERGHRFFSDLASEVILHLYEEKKERCIEDLNGVFTFAIYEKNKGKLFLARDRIGIKSLYYYFDGKRFIFSSRLKAILIHSIKRELNQEAFLHCFRLSFTPAPFTLFKGIYKLPPAHYLIQNSKGIKIKRYWDVQDFPEIKSVGEAIEKIKFLAKDSVKRRLVSDKPVGIFLSGGIDSTSVLGMASEFTGKVNTYSVGFNIDVEQEKYNRDCWFARQTSKYYNTNHHELLISDIDARDNLEKAIWYMEEPVFDSTQISIFLLSQLAKKNVDIILGGDGGDEIFGGYPRYYYSKLVDRYQLLPYFLRQNALPCLLEKVFKKKNLKEKLNTPPGISRYLLFMAEKTKTLSQILNQEIVENLSEEFLRKRYSKSKFKDKRKYLMYLDLLTWLPDESLIASNKMTMASGLEERVPILDHRLVELAFRIPIKYKVRGKKTNKWIFRQAMKEYIPAHLLRKEKRGWFSPAAKWLRRGLKDFSYDVLSPNYAPATQEYFNFQEVRRILDGHIYHGQYNLSILWSILTFQIWYKTFIEKKLYE